MFDHSILTLGNAVTYLCKYVGDKLELELLEILDKALEKNKPLSVASFMQTAQPFTIGRANTSSLLIDSKSLSR